MFDHLPVLIQVDRADADNMVRVLIDTHPGALYDYTLYGDKDTNNPRHQQI
jgi:hypothetical protein